VRPAGLSGGLAAFADDESRPRQGFFGQLRSGSPVGVYLSSMVIRGSEPIVVETSTHATLKAGPTGTPHGLDRGSATTALASWQIFEALTSALVVVALHVLSTNWASRPRKSMPKAFAAAFHSAMLRHS
jgi:hypothetical protein